MRSMKRPSPALIVAVLALVAALAGTAVAANPLASTSAKKVTKKKVRKIANKQIDKRLPWDTLDIADGAITTEKLGGQAVTSSKIARGAVGTGKIEDGAVTGPKINNGAVGGNKLDVASASNALGVAITGRRVVQNATPVEIIPLVEFNGGTITGLCQDAGSSRLAIMRITRPGGGRYLGHGVEDEGEGFPTEFTRNFPLSSTPQSILQTQNTDMPYFAHANGTAITTNEAIAVSAYGAVNLQGNDCVFAVSATRR